MSRLGGSIFLENLLYIYLKHQYLFIIIIIDDIAK